MVQDELEFGPKQLTRPLRTDFYETSPNPDYKNLFLGQTHEPRRIENELFFQRPKEFNFFSPQSATVSLDKSVYGTYRFIGEGLRQHYNSAERPQPTPIERPQNWWPHPAFTYSEPHREPDPAEHPFEEMSPALRRLLEPEFEQEMHSHKRIEPEQAASNPFWPEGHADLPAGRHR